MQFLKTYWVIGVLVVALVAYFVLRRGQGEPDDSFCERMLAKGKCAEARAWASEAQGTSQLRTIHELDNAKSLAIIQKLYELGAVRVTACDIETAAGAGETTNVLIVTLPSESEARTRLLRYERSHAGGLGFGGVRDRGQKYVFLWWT